MLLRSKRKHFAKWGKIRQNQKTLYLPYRNFLLVVPKAHFWQETGGEGVTPSNFEIFQMIPQFQRVRPILHVANQRCTKIQ